MDSLHYFVYCVSSFTIYVKIETTIHTPKHREAHMSGLSVWLSLVNYFPLEMNQPAAVWLVWLPPNQTVIWLGVESGRVERRGKLFYFGQTASASLRLNDPGDSKCQTIPQQPPRQPLSRLSLQFFPEDHKSCIFLFFTDVEKRKTALHLSSWEWC